MVCRHHGKLFRDSQVVSRSAQYYASKRVKMRRDPPHTVVKCQFSFIKSAVCFQKDSKCQLFVYIYHTGAKTHFLSRKSPDFDVSKMWILWKMRFRKCEFCKIWDFTNVNFVKSEISEMWISHLKSHFSQNSHFKCLIFHKNHILKVSFFTKFTI